jgi:hypothetical protein
MGHVQRYARSVCNILDQYLLHAWRSGDAAHLRKFLRRFGTQVAAVHVDAVVHCRACGLRGGPIDDTVMVGRVLQGPGGGGLDVLEAIILADITSLKERSLYIGLIAMQIAAGSTLGPIVGALFSEFINWR